MPTVRQESFFDPRCPFCREKVQIGARICPHCRSDLAANPQFEADQKMRLQVGGQLLLFFIAMLALGIIYVLFIARH